MTIASELAKLNAIMDSPTATADQIAAADDAIQRLADEIQDDALNQIDENTALYADIVEKLRGVVADIKANQFTDAINKVTEVVSAANGE